MQVMETILGCFGSRFSLHFLPRQHQVRMSPLGKHYDLPWQLSLGFKVGEAVRLLPFAGETTRNDPAQVFPEIEMELTATSLTFRARDRQLNLGATFKFTAPFYPQDESVSLAPFFYLDVTLDRVSQAGAVEFLAGLSPADKAIQVEIEKADLPGANLPNLPYAGVVKARYSEVAGHWGPSQPPDQLSRQIFDGPLALALYSWSPEVTPSAELGENSLTLGAKGALKSGSSFGLLLATYLDGPVLEIKEQPYHFKYTQLWPDLAGVCQYAVQQAQNIKAKTARFDDTLLGSSLGKSKTDFIAFTFQSYLANTWWAVPPTGPNPLAKDWFSVWEGNCVFHSTVDVEYNLAWIYLLLWPELLEKTLEQWRGYLHQDERGVWLSHDVGGLLGANRQVYGHHMEVEENCNFVLLVYALWRWGGRAEVRQANREVVAKLTRFVLDSDTTGNGWPNRGTANTIDDASPAVQFGREQTYLAVKALSACFAALKLLEDAQEYTELRQACQSHIARINQTLDQQAWLGDHYAVTLDRTTEGLTDPWSGRPLPPGELVGWNAYSLYTSNGLLYLLATDPTAGANLPPGDYARYRQDLKASLNHSLTEYGCTHSSTDQSNIWVSQNLHRDLIAGYLGEDLGDLTERYWAFEQFENSQGRGGCFVDTYGNNHLHYYPRGITSLGLLNALAGMRLDRVAGKLLLNPVRVPLRVPLLALADWGTGRIPWANFRLEGGQVALELENQDLLAGLELVILPPLASASAPSLPD